MAVAVDAVGGVSHANTGTSGTDATLTIGAVSNGALIYLLALSGPLQTGVTLTWDSGGTNQAMTLLASIAATNIGGASAYLFGLKNPTQGNKTAVASWPTSSNWIMCGISFSGVDQTTPFVNSASTVASTDTSGHASITITSSTGDIVVALDSQDFSGYQVPATNFTEIFHDASRTLISAAANYAAGAASVTMTHNINSGGLTAVAMVGTSVHAAGGAVSLTLGQQAWGWSPRGPVVASAVVLAQRAWGWLGQGIGGITPVQRINEWLTRARRRGRR